MPTFTATPKADTIKLLSELYQDFVEELNNALDVKELKSYDTGYCRAMSYAIDRVFDMIMKGGADN